MAIITSDTFDSLSRYVGVRLQQGVPLVDADWNELEDIRRFELQAFLKWYVGNGVPEAPLDAGVRRPDGFRIVPAGTGTANDFTIDAGIAGATDGLGNVGRILVEGLDVMIDANVAFSGQQLYSGKAGAAALAGRLGVPVVDEVPSLDGTIAVYLDVWERIVTVSEDPSLVHAGLGTESCVRRKREWVVRARAGTEAPQPGDTDFAAGHFYYVLAHLTRRTADPVIRADDIVDRRERRLLTLPATLTEDLFGVGATAYRRGEGRPAIDLREAINALLRGELPATPDAPIAPDPGDDEMSFAFGFAGADAIGFWHSNRVGGSDQVFAVRWRQDTPAEAATNPPQQITAGGTHRLPHAVQMPGGDLLVVYESDGRDIHFRRAAQIGELAAATEEPVADDPTFERHPYVVRVADQLVFMWHRNTPTREWVYRRRQYAPGFAETGASWLDPAGKSLSRIAPTAPSAAAGDMHAVVADGHVYVAFRTPPGEIAVVRLNPVSTGIESWGDMTLSSGPSQADQQPYLVVDGSTAVWALWRSGDQGIFSARYDVAANAWDAATRVPGTDALGNVDSRPAAVVDDSGAIWLFWVSGRGGDNDVWAVRRNPETGGWGEPRQVVTAGGTDDVPFARLGADGAIWLFWRSRRTGQFDLYFKRLVTAI